MSLAWVSDDDAVVVVVDAQCVQRRRDGGQVAVSNDVKATGGSIGVVHIGWILAAEHWVEEEAIRTVETAGCKHIVLAVAGRLDIGQQQSDPDPHGAADGSEGLDSQPVAEIHVVGGANGVAHVSTPGCMVTGPVSYERGDRRLVQRSPIVDQVTECLADEADVVSEPQSGISYWPARLCPPKPAEDPSDTA